MNDQDKPLGAPDLSNDQKTNAEQPPKAKRKLNWKGFFIGIIAVIIIEFFAISMLNSPDPDISIPSTPEQPSITKTASASATPSLP